MSLSLRTAMLQESIGDQMWNLDGMNYVTVSGLNLAICLVSAAGALAIFALMLQTTQHASPKAFFRGDEQGRWAMVRRLVYITVAIALFAQSMFIIDGRITMNPYSATIYLMLVVSWLVFLALRAIGVIDQDRWIGIKKEGERLIDR